MKIEGIQALSVPSGSFWPKASFRVEEPISERIWTECDRVCDMNLVCIKHEPSSLVMKKSIQQHYCKKKANIVKQNFRIVNGSSQSAEIKIRDNDENRIKYEWSKY